MRATTRPGVRASTLRGRCDRGGGRVRRVGRVHLFEFSDQPWLPTALRDGLTDLLSKGIEVGGFYDPVAPLLADALRVTGERSLLDLCSGGGGPLTRMRELLAREHGLDVAIRLSDFYPNLAAFERIAARTGASYESTPVDATAVPAGLAGFRTMFTSFHHFEPAAAQAILCDAWANGRGIGVFEFTERSVDGIVQLAFAPLAALALTPMLRPFRWSRLLLTYVLPMIPAIYAFDALVSQLRTYSPDELRRLVGPLQRADYHWEIGQVRHPRMRLAVTYLLGLPGRAGEAAA